MYLQNLLSSGLLVPSLHLRSKRFWGSLVEECVLSGFCALGGEICRNSVWNWLKLCIGHLGYNVKENSGSLQLMNSHLATVCSYNRPSLGWLVVAKCTVWPLQPISVWKVCPLQLGFGSRLCNREANLFSNCFMFPALSLFFWED